jgi:hypothetical protein
MATAKTLYLHGGFYKTGTTGVQNFCTQNREQLAATYTLYYPMTGCDDWNKHQLLFPLEGKDELWRQLSAEVENYRHCDILLSDESIAATVPHGDAEEQKAWLGKIQSYFPEYAIKSVLYVRRMDDWVKSMFNQYLKRFSARGKAANTVLPEYAAWLEAALETAPSSGIINPYNQEEAVNIQNQLRIFRDHVECFGQENVIARFYERNILKHGNIIDDIFDALGFDLDRTLFLPEDDANTQLPEHALPALITLFSSRPELDRSAQQIIERKAIQAFGAQQDSAAGIDKGVIESLIAQFDASLPGYKELFTSRPCSFSFPAIDIAPEYRLMYDLLFSTYCNSIESKAQSASRGKTLDEMKKAYDKALDELKARLGALETFNKNSVKQQHELMVMIRDIRLAVRFPNTTQRCLLAVYRPFMKIFASSENYRHFRRDSSDFFAVKKKQPYKQLRRILKFFGPPPTPTTK